MEIRIRTFTDPNSSPVFGKIRLVNIETTFTIYDHKFAVHKWHNNPEEYQVTELRTGYGLLHDGTGFGKTPKEAIDKAKQRIEKNGGKIGLEKAVTKILKSLKTNPYIYTL